MTSRLSRDVVGVLESTGWKRDHYNPTQVDEWCVALATGGSRFEIFPAAAEALSVYGGLRLEQRSPGLSMARETLELDPTLALGEDDRFDRFANVVGRRLFPLGEGGGGAYFLAISEDGMVFGVGDFIVEVGRSIDEALTNLVVGERFRGDHT
jgi:hypothetical protein